MSTAESLSAEIARQTDILNELRLKNIDAAAINAAKKKLGELRRAHGTIAKAVRADVGGTNAASNESKRERLLLKTAKVGRALLHWRTSARIQCLRERTQFSLT